MPIFNADNELFGTLYRMSDMRGQRAITCRRIRESIAESVGSRRRANMDWHNPVRIAARIAWINERFRYAREHPYDESIGCGQYDAWGDQRDYLRSIVTP